MNLENKIKEKATEIGFDLVGIAKAEPFLEEFKILKERKATGKLPAFMPGNIEDAIDPTNLLPDVKSIISLAMSYAGKEKNPGEGLISSYARGKDYHRVMTDMLEKLADFIKSLVEDNVKTLCVTDNIPLLERAVAERAGLGWIGKNNCLINPVYGSYIFLGEILVDLSLNPDKPIPNRCGSCQECLTNCKGKALTNPYILDPDKCVSYLTQKKGYLTYREREDIGTSFWGCDRCQEVCPWNDNIPADLHPEFASLIAGNIEEVLEFTRDNLPEEWQESALNWRGLRTLQRNSIIVMGNLQDSKYKKVLESKLSDASPVIRSYTVWALGKVAPVNDNIRELLIKMYKQEKDSGVRKEIRNVMEGNIDDKCRN